MIANGVGPKEMTLTVALRKFVGYLPGQGLAEFAKECKELTDADKAWFKDRFKKEFNITIVPPKVAKANLAKA